MQIGANGVAIDPDFANNRYAYLYISSNLTANPRTNSVVRLQLDPTFTMTSGRTDIVTDIAFKYTGNAVSSSAGTHSGGRIRFGPQRTGQLLSPCRPAQRRSGVHG